MHRLYTDTTPVYLRNLSFLRFWYLLRVGKAWNQFPFKYRGMTVVTLKSVFDLLAKGNLLHGLCV